MEKMKCEVIQDLIPIYLDGLASEATVQLVEEHTADCADCKNLIEIMKEPKIEKDEIEKKEIDFLKKTKKKHRKTIGIIICVVILIIAGIIAFVIPKMRTLEYDEVRAEFVVRSAGSGSEVNITMESLGALNIKHLEFEEEDGTLWIHPLGAIQSIFSRENDTEETYISKKPVKEIKINDTTVWYDGHKVSEDTIRIFETTHPYVGDAPANMKTLMAVGVGDMFGDYTIELKTDKEPYGMKIVITNPIDQLDTKLSAESRKAYYENYMKLYAYKTISVIGNLSEVTFEYVLDGTKFEVTYSESEGSNEMGESLKKYYGQLARTMQELEDDYWKVQSMDK